MGRKAVSKRASEIRFIGGPIDGGSEYRAGAPEVVVWTVDRGDGTALFHRYRRGRFLIGDGLVDVWEYEHEGSVVDEAPAEE